MSGESPALEVLRLRGEIAELGGAILQLKRSGLDSATAELLITRKRAELEWLMKSPNIGRPPKAETITSR